MAVIGVDCGGTNMRAGRFDGDSIDPGPVVERQTPRSGDDLASAIVAMCGGLGSVAAVGVGVAGLVDHRTGDLLWMPHIGGGARLATSLAELTGLAVSVDNDANAAALAEARHGSGAGHRMVLMVTVGTGIGGGLVIDGKVERGRSHLGEIGHIPLDRGGPRCSCGLRGCWEALASGTALDRAAAELAEADPSGATAHLAGPESATGRVLVAAAAGGDRAASQALARVASWFGSGLAVMVSVFDPDVIVIGGGVASAGDSFLGPAREAMAAAVSGSGVRSPTPVVTGRFGDRAGMIGAAMMARDAAGV
jgi:glucokinase